MPILGTAEAANGDNNTVRDLIVTPLFAGLLRHLATRPPSLQLAAAHRIRQAIVASLTAKEQQQQQQQHDQMATTTTMLKTTHQEGNNNSSNCAVANATCSEALSSSDSDPPKQQQKLLTATSTAKNNPPSSPIEAANTVDLPQALITLFALDNLQP